MSVAAVLCIAAALIAFWPIEPDVKTPHKAEVPALPVVEALPDPLPQTDPAAAAERLPTQFTNPFDASEVFEFPPGTPKDAARETVAEILLERANERRAQIRTLKHSPHLASASIVK